MVITLVLAGLLSVLPQEEESEVLEGHSYHGEAFNAGPRQAAYLMEGTGRVSFPVTTSSERAQAFINQGVGQVHGFWYFEAERSFRQAAAIDPECAMAYWGMAMANANNDKRATGFIAEAVKRKDKVTPRERAYIDALQAYLKAGKSKNKERVIAFRKALEKILYDHPDDLEAKAFLCLFFWKADRAKVPVSHLAANALMEQILDVEPMHPVHHYRIHLWDYQKPEKALTSAARCGPSSPSVAHMWHMPGHIYSRLKRYGDAAWQQEASARTDHAQMMRDRLLPDQIHNFAHNNEWLIRNLVYVGRARDAVDLAKNMIELPRHPKINTLKKRGSAGYGRTRLFQALVSFELWEEFVELADSPYLEPTDIPKEQVKRLRLLGRALCALDRADEAAPLLQDLEKRLADKKKARDKAIGAAEEKAKKEKKDVKKARSAAQKPFASDLSDLENGVSELKGWMALAGNDAKGALAFLKKAKGLDPMVLAGIHLAAGDEKAALKTARDHAAKRPGETLPLARLAHLLERTGNTKEAGETLEKLRNVGARIDLDAPPFSRLASLARSLDLPADWRLRKEPPADIGDRPDLDTIGPFRWSPPLAPAWTLKDAYGKDHSLADYRGRPVIVIFYLGHKCLHCAEQLQAFGPRTEEFKKQGISMVAVSTDAHSQLTKTVLAYDGDNIPFPLVSDESLEVFRAYRAYDDFEKQPLHGTFLVDGKGRVLWQDISYDPFMDVDFALRESRRLLDQTASR